MWVFESFNMLCGKSSTAAETNRAARPLLSIVTMLQATCLALPLGGCLLSNDKPEPGLDIPQAYSAGPKSEKAAATALPSLTWWRDSARAN